MNFDEHKPIYLQISDNICEKVISGEYVEEERIPSIRELGALFGVNPNTVVRSFDYLKTMEVIYDKRGVGFFIAEGAKKKINRMYKDEFYKNELPEIIKKMKMLDIDPEELMKKILTGLNEEQSNK